MKTLLTLILAVSSSIAFAGGSGGGGVMMSTALGTHGGGAFAASGNGGGTMLTRNGDGTMSNGSEIVYFMNEQKGSVQFAYGKVVDNQWLVEKYLIPSSQLEQSEIIALLKSKSLNNWAPLE